MQVAPARPAGALLPDIYRVGAIRRELGDVVTLNLEPDAGARPAFAPGQFNMLYAFGVGEVAISISADDRHRGFVHTIREVGAVSRALAVLEPGARLGLRGPFGTSWPVKQAEGADVLVIAGGLGLAPLRPAIHALLAQRERYGRIAILVGSRTPDAILYRQELEEWQHRPDVHVGLTVDHAGSEWAGNVGVVTELISQASFDPDDTLAMVCGPEVMMRFAGNALRDAGIGPDRIYLSMERNMKCAIGLCGHCQFGPSFVCKDGPVFPLNTIAPLLVMREI